MLKCIHDDDEATTNNLIIKVISSFFVDNNNMEEEDFSKLAVEDRCAHKSWKARVSGYEEAVKLFNQWDGDDANWKKVMMLIRLIF